jgi:hypothetical protein
VRIRHLTLVLVAAALAGCGGARAAQAPARDGVLRTDGCVTHTSAPATSVAGTPQPANQEALDALAQRIQPYAEQHFAGVYAGLEVVSATDRLRLYRTPSADFDSWISRDFRHDCVEVADAPHSQRELRTLTDRVIADMDYWKSHGLQLNSVSARYDGSAVEVGTLDVDRARQELPRRYGTDAPITVVKRGPVTPDLLPLRPPGPAAGA